MKLLIFIAILASILQAKHIHKEAYYQKIICNKMKGQIEYVLPDKTRVDCLTNTYAIEFDFAEKWAESIGQSLYYGAVTNRTSGVVLIMERGSRDMKYLTRFRKATNDLDIILWTIDSKLNIKWR